MKRAMMVLAVGMLAAGCGQGVDEASTRGDRALAAAPCVPFTGSMELTQVGEEPWKGTATLQFPDGSIEYAVAKTNHDFKGAGGTLHHGTHYDFAPAAEGAPAFTADGEESITFSKFPTLRAVDNAKITLPGDDGPAAQSGTMHLDITLQFLDDGTGQSSSDLVGTLCR